MDIFNILGYINKLSLLAFVVTLGVLLYQVYLLKKDSPHDKEAPVIPDFNENMATPTSNFTRLDPSYRRPTSSPSLNLVALIVVTLGVILFLSFAIFSKTGSRNKVIETEPLIKLVASSGIKIYDDDWTQLNEEKISSLSAGTMIIIALDKTEDKNIDAARIRVNKASWAEEDENLKFDEKKKVFYRDFVIATDTAFLKVEAQLHSSVDGWLGE